MSTNEITTAFSQAAAKLGFVFEPSFNFAPPGQASVHSLGLVRLFGSPVGTLIFGESHGPSALEVTHIKAGGYFYSILFSSYAKFEEPLFIGTLNDWQFFGSVAQRPSWYTGKPWL